MKVMVVGARGQLGLDLLDVYAGHDVVGLDHEQLDITDETAVAAAIDDLGPELVLHAAGMTDVDGCEGDPDEAHRVNALGPWWLARACRRVDAALVHVSTDYVFSGQPPLGPDGRPRGWTEFDATSPANAYGRSKAAGEHLVRTTLERHHIVRTAWLYGGRGNNFVRTMLRLGRERGRVDVVDDQFGSPTYARDLAGAIRELSVGGRYGTVNVTNAGHCSWFDLARATFELSRMEVEIAPITSHQLGRPAPRPSWSVLDERHARTSGLSPLPPWRDGLRRLLDELGAREPAASDH
jgi:dTDP-4-dehydrorhamnose reductase